MELEVIQHPIGSWGLRRSDGKILMRLVPQVGTRPLMEVLVFATASEAEEQRLILEPLTTEQRQELGFF